jgi:hypothetical protein
MTHSVNPNLDAPDAKPKASGMALAAMIIGIASIPLLCLLGLGALTGLIAIVLGVIALASINKDPTRGGKGMAIAGIATGASAVVLTPLFIALFLPILGRSRELANRSVCAANLRGIMQSMVVYASDNNECYPYFGASPITAKHAVNSGPGSLMHDMFYFVTSGQVGPRQFLCKSDPSPTATSLVSPPSPTAYWKNPTGRAPDLCYSYSFAFQYSAPDKLGNWWHNTVAADLPIAADMNPDIQVLPGKSVRNSINHQCDGQNVGFADAHIEFVRTPLCGEAGDHIFTSGPGKTTSSPGVGGMPYPPASGNNPGTFDTCLEPILLNTNTYDRG